MTRYARLHPEAHRHWPECYHRKLYRVVDQADPTVRDAPGYIWICRDLAQASVASDRERSRLRQHDYGPAL